MKRSKISIRFYCVEMASITLNETDKNLRMSLSLFVVLSIWLLSTQSDDLIFPRVLNTGCQFNEMTMRIWPESPSRMKNNANFSPCCENYGKNVREQFPCNQHSLCGTSMASPRERVNDIHWASHSIANDFLHDRFVLVNEWNAPHNQQKQRRKRSKFRTRL